MIFSREIKIGALLALVIYLLGAFITADLNPVHWSMDFRKELAMGWIICIAVFLALDLTDTRA